MRIANVDGRASVLVGDGIADVEEATGGRFGSSLRDVYDRWDEFRDAATQIDSATAPLELARLGNPAPVPRQVFAVGLNYRAHAEESGMAIPSVPATFTKFPASLGGPFDDIEIHGDSIDWEVELVVVIGRLADRLAAADAWSYVAGLTVGQDISDRALQFAAGSQFSLGKSRRGYGPIGPWVVTPDEFADPDDLNLGCSVDEEVVQDGRTSDMVFPVSALIAELSAIVPLWPGDVIFTGTPSGVGFTRQPARSLQPGNMLESWIEGIGAIRNTCTVPKASVSRLANVGPGYV